MLKDDIYTIIASKRDWNGELQWINRREIAQALDRPRKVLEGADIMEIAQLVQYGRVMRRITLQQNDTLSYEYKAIES